LIVPLWTIEITGSFDFFPKLADVIAQNATENHAASVRGRWVFDNCQKAPHLCGDEACQSEIDCHIGGVCSASVSSELLDSCAANA